ncbi:hypothetical protein PMZ80_002639 [Knufia obscura]|uniref:Uncharacterized protein n=1 Tax=Knufia obscura TaxID=1635080 RepID=A0ABR0RXX9_9EURO|nr:hypothetical protein PMZ80_002639 [Knufia obscura]
MALPPEKHHRSSTASAQLRPEYTIVGSHDQRRGVKSKTFPFLCPTTSEGDSNRRWLPLSLSLPVLVLFILTLLCLLAALLTIRYFATHQHGLKLVTTNHYSWTYGPTAIFVILTSFWRLVDYHCKALIPWAELEQDRVHADRSITVDHVSSFLLVTVAAAGKHRHFVVVLTVLGFLLLKIITIASTGLFFPSDITVGPFNVEMAKTTQFNALTNSSERSDPGASPFYAAYAILERGYPLPEGLTDTMLYETVKPTNSSRSSNTTYVATSQAFVPQVACDAIDVQPLIAYEEFTSVVVSQYEQLQVQNNSHWSCPPRSGLTNDGVTVVAINVAAQVCPPRQLIPSFGMLACNHTENTGNFSTHPFLVGISDVRYSQTFNVSIGNYSVGDILEPQSWEFEIPKITAMLCSIDYRIQEVALTYNMSRAGNRVQRVELLGTPENKTLPNISDDYLMTKLSYADPISAGGARDMFGLSTDYEYVEQPPNTVLTMVAEHAGGDYSYLLDHPETFVETTQVILNSMLLQVAKESIMILDTNETFRPSSLVGQESYEQQRLQLQSASLITMIAGISVMVLLVVAVIILRPEVLRQDNPGAISAQAHMLQNSKAFQSYLEQTATLNEATPHKIMRQATYGTASHVRGTTIRLTQSKETGPTHTGGPQKQSPQYHVPLTLKKACLVLTMLSAPLAIALLEVLQHLSDSRRQGIATIQDASAFAVSVYTRFLPAFITLLIATLFNCLDFNTSMLAPFTKMHARSASYSDLKRPLLAQIPPVALCSAARRGYWAAFFTTIGALVGSVLTIVVSGLFTVEFIPDAVDIPVTALDSWNLSYHQGFSSDNAATAVSSLVESGNLSYPLFTFDELVFPTLQIGDVATADIDGTLTAQLPALRAELECEELPWGLFNYTVSTNAKYGSTEIYFDGSVPLPGNCQLGSVYGNESTASFTMLNGGFNDGSNDTYIAQVQEVHIGPWPNTDEVFFTSSGTAERDQPDNAPGCPSLVMVYGYLNGGAPLKSTWTSLLCYQQLQQITTNLTMTVPNNEIPQDVPPVPNEATAQYLRSGPSDETAFWWRLQSNLEYPFQILNISALPSYLVENDDSGDGDFSNFFRGAFFGKTPLPLETLQKNDTATRDLIFNHIQMFYRRYMAQYISANMRVSTNGSSNANTKRDDIIIDAADIRGSFTPTSGTPRLVQHRTPKLVMQIMLAIMFVCGGLALWLGQYHNLVLWNPCTIAGVMVLFAGSKMCDGGDLSQTDDLGKTGVSKDGRSHEQGGDTYHDFERDITSYVMTELSSLGSTAHRDDDAGKGAVTEDKRALIVRESEGTSTGVHSGPPAWQSKQARFRLGWWKDGEYMGSNKAADRSNKDDGTWRYGIDVL